jgi:hypothetical protein
MRLTRVHHVIGMVLLGGVACGESSPTDVTSASAIQASTASPVKLGLYGADVPGAGSPSGCAAAEHRQFDFWVGDWDVFNPAGSQAGTNRILSLLEGCLVEENWAGGIRGRSMNAYDAAIGKWTQYWFDDSRTHLRLSGGLDGDAMLMSGERIFRRADGSSLLLIDRIRWTPLPSGNVNQFWDISIDGGKTFPIVAFDGTYVPTPNLQPAPAEGSGCPTAQSRGLDFWVGIWVVRNPGGKVLGHSTVSLDLLGCLVEEDFEGVDGYASQSFAGFDFRTPAFYRVHLDNRGTRLLLSGGLQNGGMVLDAVRPGLGNSTIHVRNTLRPDGADRVIQIIETSPNGTHWNKERLIYTRQ